MVFVEAYVSHSMFGPLL